MWVCVCVRGDLRIDEKDCICTKTSPRTPPHSQRDIKITYLFLFLPSDPWTEFLSNLRQVKLLRKCSKQAVVIDICGQHSTEVKILAQMNTCIRVWLKIKNTLLRPWLFTPDVLIYEDSKSLQSLNLHSSTIYMFVGLQGGSHSKLIQWIDFHISCSDLPQI